MDDVILKALAEAQAALARYVAPGGPGEKDTINALLRILDDGALVRAQRAGGPQPIETLEPKPDTSYLLFCPDQGGWHVGEWWAVEGGRWIAVIDTESELYPTHWMPAPADPA